MMPQQVAGEVRPASLPRSTSQHRGDGRFEALVGVRDHEMHPRQPAGHEAPQKGRPGGAVLGGEDVHAEDLAVNVPVDACSDHDRDVDDSPALPTPHDHRVEPDVRIPPGQRTAAKVRNHLVQFPAHLADLGLRQCLDAQRLDQFLHLARRYAQQIGLRDHRDEGALGPAPVLQQPVGEVTAVAQARYRQRDRAQRGVKSRDGKAWQWR